MQHTSSGQASPHIDEIEIPGAKMGRGIMGKAEYRDFDVLTYLNCGRIMLPGGAYEKYRIKKVLR